MGKSIQFRSFLSDEGDIVRFSSLRFRKCVNEYISKKSKEIGKRYTKNSFYDDVADAIHCSSEAVKNWLSGVNGPTDLQIIRQLANYLEVDFHDFLVDKDDEPLTAIDKNMFNLESNDEKEIIMHMYRLFVDYIYWFTGSEWETKADRLLEDPFKEHDEYILNLYYLLDLSALNISEDVYYSLRKTITELNQLEHPKHYSVWIPKDWTDLNPFLRSDEFDQLIDHWVPKGHEPVSLVEMAEDFSDSVAHMLLEDMPELHTEANLQRETDLQRAQRDEVFAKHYYENHSDLYYVIDDLGIVKENYDFNDKVCREFANTLIKIMRKRFPQYFSVS